MSPTHSVVSLQQPAEKKCPSKSIKMLRRFRAVFRSFPIITPACKIPVRQDDYICGGMRMTGTLFGHQRARINLAIHENSRSLPILLLELAIPTEKLLKDMRLGLIRIALECEKRPSEKISVLDEPIWTLYCNGRKAGYAVKREPGEEDLMVMQHLYAVSMGAGVLPAENQDGQLTYLRANFQRIIGSKDSETYYMMNPDMNSGPELSIFFIRIG
ncbi:hypothetical protein SLEP1_g47397 [Rubroshorea leprosula]|uniref:Protein MIZU-KUSSEI 1 n=1 Tax=Rubroshorea leprosula TaxID=152421 RepID=A0AAV5LRA0_9ROSI|nr:hypothetical protein SLEP1_g47397 [Rubroshorea leprosula]